MKTQPEFETALTSHDPRHADRLDAYPALQVYAAGCVAADTRHDHILRAALLANAGAIPEPCKP